VAVLLKASRAVTVTLKATPAVAEAGAETVKCVAGAWPTLIAPEVPVIPPSVAVIVREPEVRSVALKDPVPLVSKLSAGSVAAPSVLVKCALPAYPVAMLLKASKAVTVTLKATPAVAEAGAETVKWVAAAGETLIAPEVPVMEPSAAVIVCEAAVRRVALNVPVPLVRVVSVGRVAAPSVLVKCTVPAYPVAVLLKASRAVTVTLTAAPAVAAEGAETVKCAAAAGATLIVPELPVMPPSVAVIVCAPAVRSVLPKVPVPFVRVLSAGKVAAPSLLVKCAVPA
jgi:hypothetical protein